MSPSAQLRVAVLYGGRSGEHEVSLHSAASVIRTLDRERFRIIPIGIDKKGVWRLHELAEIDPEAKQLVIRADAPSVRLSEGGKLVSASSGAATLSVEVDVVFPVMHGPLCEDGTLQGLLEMANVAYVGCGVLASAVGMDKEVAKRLVRDAGLPMVPFVAVRKGYWQKELSRVREQVARELGYPCFVKPANMGSSLGVHKVKEESALEAALQDAFQYDLKVLIEKGIDAREIEYSVLENPGSEPAVSIAGEIRPRHEFYSYEAKYLDEHGADLMIPAELDAPLMKQGADIARRAFSALECEGMARVDLFLDRRDGRFYFNEVNTIPGFTQISMYPKLWAASGLPYRGLLSRLVDLAVDRQRRRNELSREFAGV